MWSVISRCHLQLELGDNKLTDNLDQLSHCPSLKHLSLVGNRIASFDDIKPLVRIHLECLVVRLLLTDLSPSLQGDLSQLSSLDLLDCPITQQEGYREQVFNLLPSLSALDGLTKEGEEVEESGSEEEEEGTTCFRTR